MSISCCIQNSFGFCFKFVYLRLNFEMCWDFFFASWRAYVKNETKTTKIFSISFTPFSQLLPAGQKAAVPTAASTQRQNTQTTSRTQTNQPQSTTSCCCCCSCCWSNNSSERLSFTHSHSVSQRDHDVMMSQKSTNAANIICMYICAYVVR